MEAQDAARGRRRHLSLAAALRQVRLDIQRGSRTPEEAHSLLGRYRKQRALNCGNPRCLMCSNPRYVGKGQERLTVPERRQLAQALDQVLMAGDRA